MMLLAEAGVPFCKEAKYLVDWPEKWLTLLQFVKHYQNNLEKAAYDSSPSEAFPPSHILWNPDALERWWKDRKGAN